MIPTKLVYLASPYRHNDCATREERYFLVCKAAGFLADNDIAVISPIAHSHPITRFCGPKNHEYWMYTDRRLLPACDELWVLCIDGHSESDGVTEEIEIAKKLNIPIHYTTLEKLEKGELPQWSNKV